MKIDLRKWIFFGVKEFFFINFDFRNGCKNQFKDNNEKSCRWSRNRVSYKIDFKALWPRRGHADSVGVKVSFIVSHNSELTVSSDSVESSDFSKSFFGCTVLGIRSSIGLKRTFSGKFLGLYFPVQTKIPEIIELIKIVVTTPTVPRYK